MLTDSAASNLVASTVNALHTAGAEISRHIPHGVKQAFHRTVGKIEEQFNALPTERQRVVLLAASAAVILAVSHVAYAWHYNRKLRREGSTDAPSKSDKHNASNSIYESEVSARQYMEFHYTPSRYTYVQKLKLVQESFDFPIRIVNKFRVYLPRSTPYMSPPLITRRANAPAGEGGDADAKAPAQPLAARSATPTLKKRALDVGCATGASVFEMSKYFDEVIGIDYSEVFVHLANEVKTTSMRRPKQAPKPAHDAKKGSENVLNVADNSPESRQAEKESGKAAAEAAWTVPYTAPVQGDNTEKRELILSPAVFPERCFFYCGDAMNMFAFKDSGFSVKDKCSTIYKDVFYWKAPVLVREAEDPLRKGGTTETTLTAADLTLAVEQQAEDEGEEEKFDAVLCSNLIDRVPDPRKLLASFALLVRKGGILILCDPYSWWEGATDKKDWIGGRNGVRSEDQVKQILLSRFELLSETEEGFLIRDHIRHYQLGFSHCTVWRRR